MPILARSRDSAIFGPGGLARGLAVAVHQRAQVGGLALLAGRRGVALAGS